MVELKRGAPAIDVVGMRSVPANQLEPDPDWQPYRQFGLEVDGVTHHPVEADVIREATSRLLAEAEESPAARARRELAEIDERLDRYRAALDAGADAAVVAAWINSATVQRDALAAVVASDVDDTEPVNVLREIAAMWTRAVSPRRDGASWTAKAVRAHLSRSEIAGIRQLGPGSAGAAAWKGMITHQDFLAMQDVLERIPAEET